MDIRCIVFKTPNEETVCWFEDVEKYKEPLLLAIDTCSEVGKIVKDPLQFLSAYKKISRIQRMTFSTKDVEEFIEGQEQFKHSHEALSRHFLGRRVRFDPRDPAERRLYDAIWRKAKNARTNLKKKYEGKWIREQEIECGIGQPAQFTFVRRNETNGTESF